MASDLPRMTPAVSIAYQDFVGDLKQEGATKAHSTQENTLGSSDDTRESFLPFRLITNYLLIICMVMLTQYIGIS